MLAFIRGKVASYGSDWIVIDHDGMGWLVSYPHVDDIHLGEEMTVYTYMHYTENDISLFGFSSMEEKDLFMRLISVKGLGPKTAMNMLAKDSYQNIIGAIESGDVSTLKKMPGIGAKSASQIVLDLKGKLVAVNNDSKVSTNKYSDEINETLEGLKGLGYKSNELNGVATYLSGLEKKSTKEYLQLALRYLAKQKLGG